MRFRVKEIRSPAYKKKEEKIEQKMRLMKNLMNNRSSLLESKNRMSSGRKST